MFDLKIFNEATWKDITAKNKGVKDNGLQKLLAEAKKVPADDHEAAQTLVDEIVKVVAQAKKAASGVPVAGKFLNDLGSAADSATRNIAKARAEAQKNAKAQAEAAKKRESEEGAKGKGDGQEDESSELLTTQLTGLLRQVAQGHRMFVLIATNGKDTAVMLSRKEIAHTRRKLLADHLGVSGGLKYLEGHCFQEEGMTTFALNHEVAGMTKKLKAALLLQTSRRVKLRCRGHDGQTDDDEDDGDAAVAVGADDEDGDRGADSDRDAPRGGHAAADGDKDDKPAAAAVDPAPEQTPAPAAAAAPAPSAAPAVTLANSPQLWKATRMRLTTVLEDVKSKVMDHIADEDGGFVEEVKGNLQQLDRILTTLDKRLINSLTNAAETDDPANRADALKESKAILADYIRYVRSEPLIAHLDNNPFGVKTNLKATLAASLTQLAKAIG